MHKTWKTLKKKKFKSSISLIINAVGGANGKEPTWQCRRRQGCGIIARSGRSHRGGHGNPL